MKIKTYNPFCHLSRFEWCLWFFSVAVVTASFFLGGRNGILSLVASLLGVTALIFVAKGDVTGQILVIVFSILYAIVSYGLKYYGEMITYVCMSAPIAFFSVISWLRHPYAKDHLEVRMVHLRRRDVCLAFLLTAAVTAIFFFVLRALNTAEIWVSTFSVATSFLAAYLLFLRSPWYALAYAANDVVLILLWVIAAWKDPAYISMVACFLTFLCNDLYGFCNWLRLRRRQESARS